MGLTDDSYKLSYKTGPVFFLYRGCLFHCILWWNYGDSWSLESRVSLPWRTSIQIQYKYWRDRFYKTCWRKSVVHDFIQQTSEFSSYHNHVFPQAKVHQLSLADSNSQTQHSTTRLIREKGRRGEGEEKWGREREEQQDLGEWPRVKNSCHNNNNNCVFYYA